jgi:hypothetical protein
MMLNAATFTVTNTNDPAYPAPPPSGSLRWAVNQVNAQAPGSTNLIKFNISGSGPHVIQLTQGPLKVYRQVTIDGTSQNPSRDYTKNDPLIIIDESVGNYIGSYNIFHFSKQLTPNLNYDASGSIIKALTLRNTSSGITLYTIILSTTAPPLSNITVENCVIYEDVEVAQGPTTADGIDIAEAQNVVIKGCYFGTNHSLITTKCKSYGIYIDGENNPGARYVKIGGPGTEANTFLNVDKGVTVHMDNGFVSTYLKYIQVTRNRFLGYRNWGTYIPNFAIYLEPWNSGANWTNENIQKPTITEIDPVDNKIKGTSGANYYIEVFKSNGAETATEYVGATTADATGNWALKASYQLNKSMIFTATATDVSLNSSGLPKNNTSQLCNVTYCKLPVIKAVPSCNARPVLSIPDSYTTIVWKKGTTTVQTGGTTLDANTYGAGSYTVEVSNTGGTCSFTSAAVVVN